MVLEMCDGEEFATQSGRNPGIHAEERTIVERPMAAVGRFTGSNRSEQRNYRSFKRSFKKAQRQSVNPLIFPHAFPN
jgi:hypothetical protein